MNVNTQEGTNGNTNNNKLAFISDTDIILVRTTRLKGENMKTILLAIYNYLKNVLITLLFCFCLLATAVFAPQNLPDIIIDSDEGKKTKKK